MTEVVRLTVPEHVEPVLAALSFLAQVAVEEQRGDDAERDVDVEDPAPGEGDGEPARASGPTRLESAQTPEKSPWMRPRSSRV